MVKAHLNGKCSINGLSYRWRVLERRGAKVKVQLCIFQRDGRKEDLVLDRWRKLIRHTKVLAIFAMGKKRKRGLAWWVYDIKALEEQQNMIHPPRIKTWPHPSPGSLFRLLLSHSCLARRSYLPLLFLSLVSL